MVGYFHPPPEQLLRNSECWRGLCNDLVLSSAWQSKSNHCSVMGFQGNIIGHLRLYEGWEGKGWRVEKIKRAVEVWVTCRACLFSCLPSRASYPFRQDHAQEGLNSLCLVLPVCDFPHATFAINPWPRCHHRPKVNHYLLLSIIDLELTSILESPPTVIWPPISVVWRFRNSIY